MLSEELEEHGVCSGRRCAAGTRNHNPSLENSFPDFRQSHEGSDKINWASRGFRQGWCRLEHPSEPGGLSRLWRVLPKAKRSFNSPLRTAARTCNMRRAPSEDHCICCFLTIRRVTSELTANSESEEAMRRPDL